MNENLIDLEYFCKQVIIKIVKYNQLMYKKSKPISITEYYRDQYFQCQISVSRTSLLDNHTLINSDI